jgi:hypothetical protein
MHTWDPWTADASQAVSYAPARDKLAHLMQVCGMLSQPYMLAGEVDGDLCSADNWHVGCRGERRRRWGRRLYMTRAQNIAS